jgi:hypothetical protein
MLEEEQPDRVYYREVKEEFGIYDLIVLGTVDDEGVFRPETVAATSRGSMGSWESREWLRPTC